MTTTNSGPADLSKKILHTVSQYVSLLGTGTADAIAGLYAPDATLEDPVGSEPLLGVDNIRAFYSRMDGTSSTADLITVRVAGNSAAFHFRVATTTANAVITIEPIDVMTFDDQGRITSMRAFWSPNDVHTVPL